MKRIFGLMLVLIVAFSFAGCDFDEKSIRSIYDRAIPQEVTKDFVLPRGAYAPITYTSSHPDVLEISNLYDVKVNQQDEDVIVTIEARVKSAFKIFEIKVLKKGSELTLKEQADLAFEKLNQMFEESISRETLLPNEIDNILFDYELDSYYKSFSLVRKFDGTKWLVPILNSTPSKDAVKLRVTVANETDEYIPTFYLNVSYVYDSDNLLPQEEIFLSLGMDFKFYSRGSARLYLKDNDTLDFTYQGDQENVNVVIRLPATSFDDDLTIYNNTLYVNTLSKNKTYYIIVSVDIDGITQEFRVFIEKSNIE